MPSSSTFTANELIELQQPNQALQESTLKKLALVRRIMLLDQFIEYLEFVPDNARKMDIINQVDTVLQPEREAFRNQLEAFYQALLQEN